MRWWIPALGMVAVAGGVMLFGRSAAAQALPATGHRSGPFSPPIAVGRRTDPKIAELLAELDAYLANAGVDTSTVSGWELTRMASVGQAAIPPRAYWPRMVVTLREVYEPLRKAIGVPLVIRSAYRAPDYNAAVGGAKGSRHQAFEAMDLRVESTSSTAAKRRELALLAGQIYSERGKALKMGFGAYGQPVPGNIHVDTGWQRRTWQDAKAYLP